MFANIFIVCSSVVVLVNCIIIPGHNVTKKTLNTIGIKTLGWQGPDHKPSGDIIMHHNYSKVENVNNTNWSEQLNENFDQTAQNIDQIDQNFDQIDQKFDQNFDQITQKHGQTNFDQQVQNFDFPRAHRRPQQPQFPNVFVDGNQQIQRAEKYANLEISVYRKCPKGATGQFAYDLSCNQFINCWKGRGVVQNCATGTLFNPVTSECDFPEKVNCVTGPRNMALESNEMSGALQARCPQGFSGTIPHYTDCSKFMTCNNGVEVEMDCPPGTLFDVKTNVCDHAYKCDCADPSLSKTRGQDSRFHQGFTNKFVLVQPYQGNWNHLGAGLPQNHRGHVNGHLGRFSQNQTSVHGINDQLGGFSQSSGTSTHFGTTGISDQLGGFSRQPNQANDHLGQFSSHHNQHNWGANSASGTGTSDQLGGFSRQPGQVNDNLGQFSSHQIQYHRRPNSSSGTGINDQMGGFSHQPDHVNSGQFSSHHTQYHRRPNSASATGINDQRGGFSNQPDQANLGQFSFHQTQYHRRPNSASETGINDQLGGFSKQSGQVHDHLGQSSSHQYDHRPSSASEASQSTCFPGSVGLRRHPNECTKYLDCSANGQEKSCPPGTRFNERTSICDDAHKVSCHRSDQVNGQVNQQGSQHNQQSHGQYNRQHLQQTDQYTRTQVTSRPKCSHDQVGLYPHPTDCSKFLNCGPNGQTFIQDCGPGTVFNPAIKVCDYPYRTKCGTIDQNQHAGQGGQQPGVSTTTPRETQHGFSQSRPDAHRTQYGWQGYNENTQTSLSNQNQHQLGLESQNVQTVANAGFHGNRNVNNRTQFGWVGTNVNLNQPNQNNQQNLHQNQGQQTQNKPNLATDHHGNPIVYNPYGWHGFNVSQNVTSNQNLHQVGRESQNVQTAANVGFHGQQSTIALSNRTQFGWVGANTNPTQTNQNLHQNHGQQTQNRQNVYNQYVWHGYNVTQNVSRSPNQQFHSGLQTHDMTNTNQFDNSNIHQHGYNHGAQTQHKQVASTGHHVYDQVPYDWQGFNVSQNANRTQSSNQRLHTNVPIHQGTRTHDQQGSHHNHWHRTQNSTDENRNQFQQNLHWQGGRYVRPIYVQIQNEDQTTQGSKHSPAPFPRTDPNADYVFEDKDFMEVEDLGTGRKDFCSPKDFRCEKDVCVDQMKVCDGYADCDNAKDESNCERYVEQFVVVPKVKLAVKEKAKYFNTTLSLCAKSCTETQGYQCKAFNYRKNDATCFVLDTNVGLSGGLFMLPNYDYYEYRKFTVDCTNMYQCNNKKCINYDRMCDGVNDCGDGMDEKGCKAEKLGYSVKLVGSPNPHEGIVLVSAFGKSGFICDDMFGLRDGNVLCRELGFELGALQVQGNSHSNSDNANETFYMMDDVTCLGNETSLRDCDFNGWGVHNCVDREIVSVVCKTPQKTCPEDTWKCETGNDCVPFSFVCDGVSDCDDRSDEGSQYCEAAVELRLAGGKSKKDGRVEIRYHGSWGTVCDDDFNDEAAKVVCRYLGYAGFSKVKKDGYYGPGKGQIWLDQVFCQGNETSLEECYHWDWGVHNCDHGEDVGVECGDRIEESPRNAKPDITQRLFTPAFSNRCGYRNDDIFLDNDDVHFRVVKGLVAQKGHYPWQASLRLNVKNKASHWCGAVVLSQLFVLTAAHCLSGYPKGGFVVVVGDYEVDVDEGTEQKAYIEEFYIHPEFRNGTRMNNDVALVKLKGSGLNITKDVQPICLPDVDFKAEQGMNCTISGFGSVQSGKAVASKELRAGWIPIQAPEVCKMPHIYGESITDGMLCAGSLDEGVDACDGDSGGPLACLHQGLFTLAGVTSWGQHCGYANKPGVYVRVAHYRNWIDETIQKHT